MAEAIARSRDWFQIVSNVAIIIGLGLVIYELNQSKALAYVQFVNNDFARYTERHVALMGEDPREALAKAALRPSDLREPDVVTLDALYREITMGWVSMVRTEEIAGLERGWREVVANEARTYFASGPGRRWLKTWAAQIDERERFMLSRIAEVAIEAAAGDAGGRHEAIYQTLLATYEPR